MPCPSLPSSGDTHQVPSQWKSFCALSNVMAARSRKKKPTGPSGSYRPESDVDQDVLTRDKQAGGGNSGRGLNAVGTAWYSAKCFALLDLSKTCQDQKKTPALLSVFEQRFLAALRLRVES